MSEDLLYKKAVRVAYENPGHVREMMLPLLVKARRKKAPSIDAVVTFKHDGTQVVAKVLRTQWKGGGLKYIWETDKLGTIITPGLPKDLRVLEDPDPRGK
jgi:hypothetical protein